MFAWLKRWYKRKACSSYLLERDPTDKEIASACMYYDHSYGLMDEDERKRIVWMATEWLHSWKKVEEDCHKRAGMI